MKGFRVALRASPDPTASEHTAYEMALFPHEAAIMLPPTFRYSGTDELFAAFESMGLPEASWQFYADEARRKAQAAGSNPHVHIFFVKLSAPAAARFGHP